MRNYFVFIDDDDKGICRARHKESSDALPISKCRANVRGERVAVRRAAGKVFHMTGPATAKLLISSVVVVLGTDSAPVRVDRRCPSKIHFAELDLQHGGKTAGIDMI